METNKNICAICGRNISGAASRDHIFPRALYKWSEEYLTDGAYQELKSKIESPDNIILTHPDCNFEKEDAIPDINVLHLTQTKHADLLSISKAIDSSVISYCDHKQKLLSSQNGCCAYCGKPLPAGVLRRRNPDYPRRWDNACIVCHECNLNNERF